MRGLVAGWSSLAARRAHNPKVAGSNPAPATISANSRELRPLPRGLFLRGCLVTTAARAAVGGVGRWPTFWLRLYEKDWMTISGDHHVAVG